MFSIVASYQMWRFEKYSLLGLPCTTHGGHRIKSQTKWSYSEVNRPQLCSPSTNRDLCMKRSKSLKKYVWLIKLEAILRIVFISLKVVQFYSAYLLGMFTIFSTTACHYFVLAFVASLHASNSHELAWSEIIITGIWLKFNNLFAMRMKISTLVVPRNNFDKLLLTFC